MSESQDFAGFTGADLTDWRTSSSDMKDDGGLYDDILTGSLKEIPPKPLYVDQPHSSMTIAGPQASLKRKFSCSNEFSFPPMQQGYHSPILCYPMVETSVKVHRTIDEIRDRLNGATPFSQPFLIGEVSSGRHVLVASIPGVTGWQAEITNDNDHSTEIQSVIFLMECAADDKTLINTSGLTDAEKVVENTSITNCSSCLINFRKLWKSSRDICLVVTLWIKT